MKELHFLFLEKSGLQFVGFSKKLRFRHLLSVKITELYFPADIFSK